jgi:hypothetical protein
VAEHPDPKRHLRTFLGLNKSAHLLIVDHAMRQMQEKVEPPGGAALAAEQPVEGQRQAGADAGKRDYRRKERVDRVLRRRSAI